MTLRPFYDLESSARPSFLANALGIRSRVSDPRELPKEDFVVGIFGGSVARAIGLNGAPSLRAALEGLRPPGSPGVRVVNFASSGYKQPQQLYQLPELLLLGVPIDIVVNIDGFNELALVITNANRGHHPLYPEHSFWISALGSTTGALIAEQIELRAQMLHDRRRATGLRQRLSESVLSGSALARTLVGLLALRAEVSAVEAEEELRELPIRTAEEDLFRLEAPCLGRPYACWDLVLDIWTRSSLQMRALAESVGAVYFHFLQPNQYLEGSKRLTEEELAVAWRPEHPWSEAARRGCSRLRQRGEELATEGVRFHDLTQIFRAHDETIGTDSCCHFNQQGSEIIGREIGETIGRAR